jgi:hypothetical protein
MAHCPGLPLPSLFFVALRPMMNFGVSTRLSGDPAVPVGVTAHDICCGPSVCGVDAGEVG